MTGVYLKSELTYVLNHQGYGSNTQNNLIYLAIFAQITSAGVILTSILQIYNWFSYKNIITVVAVFFCAELFGYITPIPLLPDNEIFYHAAQPMYYFIFGSLFFAFSILDLYIFIFSPLEKNILVDQRQEILLSPQIERRTHVSNSALSPFGRDEKTFEML